MLKMQNQSIFEYLYIFKCLICENLLGKELDAAEGGHIYQQLQEKINKIDNCECGYCGNKIHFKFYPKETSIFHRREGIDLIRKKNKDWNYI